MAEETELDFVVARFVTDPDTLETLPIEPDDRWFALLASHARQQCKHEQKAPHRTKIANGAFQVRNVCVSCGEKVGTALSQKDRAWVASLPVDDGQAHAAFLAQREASQAADMVQLGRAQAAERGNFTQAYQDYMKKR